MSRDAVPGREICAETEGKTAPKGGKARREGPSPADAAANSEVAIHAEEKMGPRKRFGCSEEPEPEAMALGMEAGDITPETCEMSKVREPKGQEAKSGARIRKEEGPRKDVTLKRSFAAGQAPPISASGAFASEDRMFPPCMLTRKSASDARAGERLRPVCAMFRARAPSRGFFLSASGTCRYVQALPHTQRAAQMPLERPLHRPG